MKQRMHSVANLSPGRNNTDKNPRASSTLRVRRRLSGTDDAIGGAESDSMKEARYDADGSGAESARAPEFEEQAGMDENALDQVFEPFGAKDTPGRSQRQKRKHPGLFPGDDASSDGDGAYAYAVDDGDDDYDDDEPIHGATADEDAAGTPSNRAARAPSARFASSAIQEAAARQRDAKRRKEPIQARGSAQWRGGRRGTASGMVSGAGRNSRNSGDDNDEPSMEAVIARFFDGAANAQDVNRRGARSSSGIGASAFERALEVLKEFRGKATTEELRTYLVHLAGLDETTTAKLAPDLTL